MGSGPLTKIQKPLDRLDSRIPVIYRSGLGHSLSSFRFRPILHEDDYIPIIHAFPTPPQRAQSCPLFVPLRAAGPPTTAFCGKSKQALLDSQSTRVHRICGNNIVIRRRCCSGPPWHVLRTLFLSSLSRPTLYIISHNSITSHFISFYGWVSHHRSWARTGGDA